MKKKIFSLLLSLLLLTALLPAQEAKAYSQGQKCPYCNEGILIIIVQNDTQHAYSCNNMHCVHAQSTGYIWENHRGTATCTSPVQCEVCGKEYGDPQGHDWESKWTIDGDVHYHACSRCDARKDEEAHTYTTWTYVDDDTCKGVCVCGAQTTEAHYDRWASACGRQPHCEKCDRDYGTIPEHEMWYEDRGENGHKPNCYHCDTWFFIEPHTFGDWKDNGDGTHTGTCVCGRTETVAHTYTWTYVDDDTCKGVCVCGAQTTEAHYDRWASACGRQPHCEKCDHDYGSIGEHEMWYEDRGENGHKPNCYHCDTWFFIEPHTFGDWKDNGDGTHTGTCVCGRTETVVHSGGTDTCTEGAKCSLCGAEYGTPLGHDLVHHEAQAPTCTQSGHTGGTHCSACGEVLSRQTVIPATGHWFKNWTPAGEGEHQGRCLRCGAFAKADCVFVTLPQADPDAAPLSLCPICGHREDGADLLPVKGAKTDCLYGNLAVFMTGEDEPERLLTVAFEWNGRLLQPRSTVNVTLPAALLDGFDLLLIAPDGTEAQIVPEITDDKAVFTLNFVIEGERLLMRFLRLKQKA